MHNHLLNYIKCIVLLNNRLIISCFQNNFENRLVERKVFTIKDKKFFSYHNYLLHLCNKYNKKIYHSIYFTKQFSNF